MHNSKVQLTSNEYDRMSHNR